MADQPGITERMTACDSGPEPGPERVRELLLKAEHPVPIVPNLLATLAGFIALLAAPWICLQIHQAILEDAIVDDQGAGMFVMLDLGESVIIAAGGSVLFLVVGIILQVWQYHRPFSSGWPVVLAFPIALGLLLPEALLRGGRYLTGAIVGAAIAVAFGLHWVSLVILREEMD